MGRRDTREKKWGDETLDGKKKRKRDARPKKMERQEARQKKGRQDTRQKKLRGET